MIHHWFQFGMGFLFLGLALLGCNTGITEQVRRQVLDEVSTIQRQNKYPVDPTVVFNKNASQFEGLFQKHQTSIWPIAMGTSLSFGMGAFIVGEWQTGLPIFLIEGGSLALLIVSIINKDILKSEYDLKKSTDPALATNIKIGKDFWEAQMFPLSLGFFITFHLLGRILEGAVVYFHASEKNRKLRQFIYNESFDFTLKLMPTVSQRDIAPGIAMEIRY